MLDAIIIGGGPAGISAALTLRQRGKSVTIISAAPENSALYKAELVDNYPGLASVSGRELLEKLTVHAKAAGVETVFGRATSAMPMGKKIGVAVGRDFLEGQALVIAVGSAPTTGFPGESDFLGRGVSYCATCDGMLHRGKRVAVIGLSAEAPEEADYLRSIGCEVEYFDKKRAKKYEIKGEDTVTTLIADGEEHAVSAVFIFRAAVAPDTLMPGLRLEGGRIASDEAMAASLPGVFTCGDCAGPPYQVAKAVGEGNIAGLSAAKYIEKLAKEG